jgi:hypothetical protein
MLLVLNLLVMPIGFLVIIYVLNRLGKNRSKFNQKQKNGWLVAHILFVIIYFGGLLGSLVMVAATKFTDSREMIYASHLYIQYFDWFLIIPGGIGSLLTGIWLAIRTQWGLAKHYWVIVKWVGNITAVVFGANFMRVWLHDNFSTSFADAVHPLQNPFYLSNRLMIFVGLGISFVLLITLVIVSYYKPWGKRKQAKH